MGTDLSDLTSCGALATFTRSPRQGRPFLGRPSLVEKERVRVQGRLQRVRCGQAKTNGHNRPRRLRNTTAAVCWLRDAAISPR
ncbi:MAG: hypothetical protein QOJ19_3889 [Acidimicrobiia bacterium]|jgi:hypothetical protein|nr:hypothetical protein [Acidimicrobiia bacterium]